MHINCDLMVSIKVIMFVLLSFKKAAISTVDKSKQKSYIWRGRIIDFSKTLNAVEFRQISLNLRLVITYLIVLFPYVPISREYLHNF